MTSTYNSRANYCERVHKAIRQYMTALGSNSKNYITNLKLAFSRYNSASQEPLGNMAPLEVLTGIVPRPFICFPPENYVEDQGPEEKSVTVENDDFESEVHEGKVLDWLDYLSEIQFALNYDAWEKFHNLRIEKSRYAVDDLVIVKDPKIDLSKIRPHLAQGPFLVKKVYKNCYQLVHCFTGSKILRNGRFLNFLHVAPDLKEKLIKEASEDNPSIINFRQEPNIKNYTKVEISDEKNPETDFAFEIQDKPYNLRSRK